MKYKRKRINLFLIILGFILLTGCEYDYIEPVKVDIPETVSFSSDIIPIFDQSCNMSGCHNDGGTSPDLTAANAYDDLFANNMVDTITPESSILYVKLQPGGTHDGRSTSAQRDYILAWIQQGALEN